MPFTIKDIIYGGVTPVIVACIVLLASWRLFSSDIRERYSASVAMVTGFLAGYALLSLAPWEPTAHWHWLPYALMMAAIVGPIASADGIRWFERPLLYLYVALVAGWFLVPTWEDLTPSQIVYLSVFAAYVLALASLLEPLAKRVTGPVLPFVLWATLTATAVVLALSGSLRFAQIALPAAGALFGIAIAACLHRETNHLSGIALLFSIMAVGLMLIGRVNSFSQVPLVSYLLVPAAPISVWFSDVGPLSRLDGVKRHLVRVLLPLILLAGALLLAAIADMNGNGEY